MPYAPLLPEAEISARLSSVPEWQREADAIRREVKLADFRGAMRLVNAVADAAEAANHHPDIEIHWNRVTFTLSSHASGGLTVKDFDLAEEIDRLVAAQG